MATVPLVTVLPGAIAFKERNVNDTFRCQVLLADGSVETAIVKDLDTRQLANELLAAVLARALDLPVPNVALGRAQPKDLPAAKAPRLDDGSRIVFVSRDMKVPNLTRCLQTSTADPAALDMIINDVKSWADLGRLYAFDAWVANIDRHPGNLLFGGKQEVWLIDHGHCFSGPAWRAADLVADASYRHRLSEWMTKWLTVEEKGRRSIEIEGCADAMTQIDIATATSDSYVANLLSVGDVQAVVGFLRERIARVPRHGNAALDLPGLL